MGNAGHQLSADDAERLVDGVLNLEGEPDAGLVARAARPTEQDVGLPVPCRHRPSGLGSPQGVDVAAAAAFVGLEARLALLVWRAATESAWRGTAWSAWSTALAAPSRQRPSPARWRMVSSDVAVSGLGGEPSAFDRAHK